MPRYLVVIEKGEASWGAHVPDLPIYRPIRHAGLLEHTRDDGESYMGAIPEVSMLPNAPGLGIGDGPSIARCFHHLASGRIFDHLLRGHGGQADPKGGNHQGEN